MSVEIANPETVEQHIRTCSERIASGVMVCDERSMYGVAGRGER